MGRVTVFILMVGLAGAAFAERDPRLQPVDQAVGDLDALSVSQRQIGGGLREDGEHTSLFVLAPRTTVSPQDEADRLSVRAPIDYRPVYYRLAPGVRARVQRLDYVIPVDKDKVVLNQSPVQDGQFLDLAGPNTVYELSPRIDQPPMSAVRPTNPYRIDTRIDARVNARVDARAKPQVLDWSAVPRPTPLPQGGEMDSP
jgi:hypothetical protein